MYTKTTALTKILGMTGRLRAVSGGTSASKTISILMWLIDYAQTHPLVLISVVSESLPHLRRGAIRDFQSIMKSHNYWRDSQWLEPPQATYAFENGSKIEFFSVDSSDRVRGPRRDILFINEANNISYETFTQLDIRTKSIVWLDWNPVSEFWWYTDVAPHMPHKFITLTYRDNEGLSQEIIDAIEARRHNKAWYQVYGKGELGEAEHRIYKGWRIIDEIPHEARLERYGLDFGYTNDPTALISIHRYNGGYILQEELYRTNMNNRQIADQIQLLPHALVIADSSEPKSIDEIRGYGVNIIGAAKGPDSVRNGITHVQDQRISVTKSSVNLIKEYRNYLWLKDKNDKIINSPEEGLDHAMDALRYGIVSLRGRSDDALRELQRHIPANSLLSSYA